MKFRTVKKIICVLLSLITVLLMPLSAFAVKLNAAPVIYIGDISENSLYENPNKNNSSVVYDMNSSGFKGSAAKVVAGIALGGLTGDYKTGLSNVLTGIQEIMKPILCSADGTSANANVGPWYYAKPVSDSTTADVYSDDLQTFVSSAAAYITADELFVFSYDWRLDPTATAQKLCDFIDHVEAVTGSTKVSLLATGFGGVVVNSYLNVCSAHAEENIASCIFYNCSLLGNAVIGDFMKGRIAKLLADSESLEDVGSIIKSTYRGEAFGKYLFVQDNLRLFESITETLLGESNQTTLVGSLTGALVNMIVEMAGAHESLGEAYNNFVLLADEQIYDGLLRDYLRNMPGLWALVPEEDFDDAIDFMFEGEDINPQLSNKIENYRKVLKDTESTLKGAQRDGINVCIVANYGIQLLPLTVSLDDISDGIESVQYASVGASTAENGEDFVAYENCVNSKHTHTNPDGTIDASFCALPESTWFINGLYHASFDEKAAADFLVWLVFGFSQRYVRENVAYPQFMEFNKYNTEDVLIPDTLPGDEYGADKYGDIDEDGDVDSADARLALRAAVKLDTLSKEKEIVADVNGDRDVTAEDARLILRKAVGLDSMFPVQ